MRRMTKKGQSLLNKWDKLYRKHRYKPVTVKLGDLIDVLKECIEEAE